MRFPLFIAGIVFLVITFAAGPSKATSNSEVSKLLKEAGGGPIYLTDKTFEKVVNGPRDYDLILLLTAVDLRFGCQFCRVLDPEFSVVANSWHSAQPLGEDNGLIFAIADLQYTQKTFQSLKLTHAPNLWIYKETSDVSSHYSTGYDVYKFPQSPEQVDALVSYVRNTMGYTIKIKKPFPIQKVVTAVVIACSSLLFMRVYFWKGVQLLQTKKLWVAISLVSILLFTSGHMYNSIRKTPYVAGDGQGGISYFVPGHSNQVAIETQIVAIVYAILSFSTIVLITKVPALNDPRKQLLLVVVLSAIIFLTYSFLISKFHVKNGGYPFWLLKF